MINHLFLFASVSLCLFTHWQQEDLEADISTVQATTRVVAARVNSFEITTQAAQRFLSRSLPNLGTRAEIPELVDAALGSLIDRRIVYEYLVSLEQGPGMNEILLELENLKQKLTTIELSLDDYLSSEGISQSELKFEFAWQIAWNRYLKTTLDDQYLQLYFQQHEREFDGSEMRVAHLLLKVSADQPLASALQAANEIRTQMRSNTLEWSAAVEKFSQAPTRGSGGELGWISFDHPMPKSFAKAAFALQLNEISTPVTTPFGVHLIYCLEIKEGKKGWRDAMQEVRESATAELFHQIAAQHRSQVTVEFLPPFEKLQTRSTDP